ncbi:hypothetical protein BYT27DRAFT_7224235 [Phlegmacium glaucopus]|nr:hypothetical protein BYT27DRAFT_7224235 [Phlegmacium glaucopus]
MDLTMNLHHRQTAGPSHSEPSHAIGDPMSFVSGQFAGRTIRFELQELQKAQSGRKYAKVDRRPLDPPPAVLLRLIESGEGERPCERELSYENVQNVGLICTVDLFPVPEYRTSHAPPSPRYSPYAHQDAGSGDTQTRYPLTYFPVHPYMSLDADGTQASVTPFQIPRRQPMLGHLYNSEIPQDVVFQIDNHLITESSKLTPALVGEKCVESALVDHKGRKGLVFVFGDLAVRREGVFILRYRAFDIFSGVSGSPHPPVLAELYGGAFKVYSTREFPGLEPSTELTRNLSKYGVRVTLRDAERKSKKREKKS